MNLYPGCKVRFLNDVGEGKVLSVSADSAVVLRSDGFEEHFPFSELIPIIGEDVLAEALADVEIRPKDAEVIRISKSETYTPRSDSMEVDLHIHNLVDNERTVSKDKILEIQLYHARRAVDHARKRKIRRLVLIHGIGQGILRTEIIKLLDGYDRLQYFDASYQKYGKGATEIELW